MVGIRNLYAVIDVKDVYWSAGLMDGEGSFMLRRGLDPVVSLCMTDKDVVDRMHSIWGFGLRRETGLPSGKTAFWWTVVQQEQAAGVMMTLLPLMGDRRARKIMECLAAWRSKPITKKRRDTCAAGHLLAGANLRVITEGKYTKRRCLECAKMRQRKHRALACERAAA